MIQDDFEDKEECMADDVLTLAGTAALTDEEIVERVLAGDTALYEVVVRRYNTRLYRLAHAIVSPVSESAGCSKEPIRG
jgi:hypothetical protein